MNYIPFELTINEATFARTMNLMDDELIFEIVRQLHYTNQVQIGNVVIEEKRFAYFTMYVLNENNKIVKRKTVQWTFMFKQYMKFFLYGEEVLY